MIERGQIVDIGNQRIFKGEVTFENGVITSIIEKNHDVNQFIMPGFIDAHIHIESSMLVPSEFAKLAVAHGTIATISDPHEIANVMGLEGVNFMIENGKNTPFKFYFGAPSCVPATAYESSGASINSDAIKALLAKDDIKYCDKKVLPINNWKDWRHKCVQYGGPRLLDICPTQCNAVSNKLMDVDRAKQNERFKKVGQAVVQKQYDDGKG